MSFIFLRKISCCLIFFFWHTRFIILLIFYWDFFGNGIFHYYVYIEGILHIFLHHGIDKCLLSLSSTCAIYSHHHRVEAEVHNIHSLSFSVHTYLPVYFLLLLLVLKRKGAKMTFHHSRKNAEIVNNDFKLPSMRMLDRF